MSRHWWIISVWVVGQVVRMLHVAASMFLTYAIAHGFWTALGPGLFTAVLELCTVTWMVAVSYVSHQQIVFILNQILTRELSKGE